MSITATCSMAVTLRSDGRILSEDKMDTQKIPINLDIALEVPCTTELGIYLANEIMNALKPKIEKSCIGIVEHGTKRYGACVRYGLELPPCKKSLFNIKPE